MLYASGLYKLTIDKVHPSICYITNLQHMQSFAHSLIIIILKYCRTAPQQLFPKSRTTRSESESSTTDLSNQNKLYSTNQNKVLSTNQNKSDSSNRNRRRVWLLSKRRRRCRAKQGSRDCFPEKYRIFYPLHRRDSRLPRLKTFPNLRSWQSNSVRSQEASQAEQECERKSFSGYEN